MKIYACMNHHLLPEGGGYFGVEWAIDCHDEIFLSEQTCSSTENK